MVPSPTDAGADDSACGRHDNPSREGSGAARPPGAGCPVHRASRRDAQQIVHMDRTWRVRETIQMKRTVWTKASGLDPTQPCEEVSSVMSFKGWEEPSSCGGHEDILP